MSIIRKSESIFPRRVVAGRERKKGRLVDGTGDAERIFTRDDKEVGDELTLKGNREEKRQGER